jgi:serine/threonine-protein kinase HipA
MLWGAHVGAATWDAQRGVAAFEYTDAIVDSGVELSPLRMPLARSIYQFPAHARTAFGGLPGLLSDALPDTFGHAVIDAHLGR